ncbi:MAG: hypothetical protein GX575_33815 [Candidatus Anammoximicrobium sp.]|nr:hypothetical protein [Candidatus Anammoximicrobium sp.]
MTTFTDRRCTAVADTSEADSERMRKRQSIREKAGRDELTLAPIALWKADIESSQQRVDDATDQHNTACVPWQDELGRLEELAVQRIGQRLPADPEGDSRRAELLALINEANKALEETIQRENETQGELRRKIHQLQTGIAPPSVTLMRLAQPPAASPQLLAELFVAKQRIAFATARVKAAGVGLRIAEANLDGIRRNIVSGELAVHTHKANCWRAELEAGEAEQAAALTEAERVHRAMIDE